MENGRKGMGDGQDEKGCGTAMQSAVRSICHTAQHDCGTFWSLERDYKRDTVGLVISVGLICKFNLIYTIFECKSHI